MIAEAPLRYLRRACVRGDARVRACAHTPLWAWWRGGRGGVPDNYLTIEQLMHTMHTIRYLLRTAAPARSPVTRHASELKDETRRQLAPTLHLALAEAERRRTSYAVLPLRYVFEQGRFSAERDMSSRHELSGRIGWGRLRMTCT